MVKNRQTLVKYRLLSHNPLFGSEDLAFNHGQHEVTHVEAAFFPPRLLPPGYRECFQKKNYRIPQVIGDELETMPRQIRNAVESGFTDHYPDSEKLSMIQDYFAFCAYGDSLVGQAVNALTS